MNLEAIKLGHSAITALSLEQMKEFLGRAAIIAYNRQGMRRLLENSTNGFPSQKELIEMFCRHMHLDDYSFVKDRINTTGKRREQSLSGKFERNSMINLDLRNELREDLTAKRVAKVMKDRGIKETDSSTISADQIASSLLWKVTGLSQVSPPGAPGKPLSNDFIESIVST